ncbi:MAG: helix-turn-helix transcriptional regulator [Pseudomonadota bacterium]
MVTDEELSCVRELAYEASSEPAKWSGVLDRVRELFDATSSHLRATPPEGHRGEIWWLESGLDPAAKQGYSERWGAYDPWGNHPDGHRKSRAGRCFIGSQILPWRELVKTAYYNEFGRFAGTKGVMTAMIEDSLSGAVAPEVKLVLFREPSLPEYEPDALRAFQALQVPLRRAVNGYWAFRFLHGQAEAAQEAFELQSQPLFLATSNLLLLHCNRAASQFCGASGSVSLGRLRRLANLTEEMLLELARSAPSGGPQVKAVWWMLDAQIRTGRIRIQPLSPVSPLRRIWPGTELVITVEASGDVEDLQVKVEGLRSLYRLTPAEVRTLAGLSSGRSPEDVCADLGVRISTVRTHIRRLLEKTGSQRIVDLVRKVTGLM